MKSADIFNRDVSQTGRYRYTTDRYSSVIATGIQTRGLVEIIKKHYSNVKTILDVGCGDGTFTFELVEALNPKNVLAFDPASKSIKLAIKDTPKKYKHIVKFRVGDIYEMSRFIRPNQYDIVVLRGVLHHLDQPTKAIAELSKVAKDVFILEPSGFNPILKIIEKTSSYHIEHLEKSYFPPSLNSWFRANGYTIIEQKFFSLVPYFAPDWMVNILLTIAPLLENIPFISVLYCGTNLFYAKKL